MKKLLVLAGFLLTTLVAFEGPQRVEAMEGQMCFKSRDCWKCEVCVKRHAYDPSGVCMPMADCR